MNIQTAPKLLMSRIILDTEINPFEPLTSKIIVDTEINPFHQSLLLKPSDEMRSGDMSEVSQSTTSYVKVKELAVPDRYMVGGRIRVKWQAKCTSADGYVRVYVNGVAVSAEQYIGSTGYGDLLVDIAINGPGLIQLYAKATRNPVFIRNFTLCADEVIFAAAKGQVW